MAPDTGALEAKVKSGASWFYWIAGLSLVNSMMAFAGEDRTFLVGLAATQVVDALAAAAAAEGGPPALQVLAIGFDVVFAGLLMAAGALARRGSWVYAAGLVLYALDAGVAGLLGAWPVLGFHLLALFFLWGGLSALRQLRAAEPAPAGAPSNRLVR